MSMQDLISAAALKRLLLDEDDHSREITDMVENYPRTFFALAELLKDKDPRVRAEAISTIWGATYSNQTEFYLQRVHHIVAPLVFALLEDPDPEVRSAAASGVGSFPYAQGLQLLREATPRLLELLDDPDRHVQESAGSSLLSAALGRAENEPEAALHILSQLAAHGNAKVRRKATWIPHHQAHKFAAVRKEITALLSSLAMDPDKEVRKGAKDALEAFALGEQPQ